MPELSRQRRVLVLARGRPFVVVFAVFGLASGIASTSRQVGTSLGVAISGSILDANLHGSLRAGYVPASHGAWLVLAGCGAAIALLGFVANSPRALRTAARTAAAYDNGNAQAPVLSSVPDTPKARG